MSENATVNEPKAMRTVVFMRHGHAEEGTNDAIRPLSPRGMQAAKAAASELRAQGFQPSVVLSSDAVRARTTADIAARVFGYTGKIVERADLYLAKPYQVIRAVKELDARYGRALVVGHNPGLEQLAARFGHAGGLSPAEHFLVSLPLATWSEFDVDLPRSPAR